MWTVIWIKRTPIFGDITLWQYLIYPMMDAKHRQLTKSPPRCARLRMSSFARYALGILAAGR